MTPLTATTVIDKLDDLLEDDRNFSTRSGLRLMIEVVKEALTVIGEASDQKHSMNTRLSLVETALHEFLEAQKQRREKDDDERRRWRWALIGPTLTLALAELAQWIFK